MRFSPSVRDTRDRYRGLGPHRTVQVRMKTESNLSHEALAQADAKTLRATEFHFLTMLQACSQGGDFKDDRHFREILHRRLEVAEICAVRSSPCHVGRLWG